MTIRSALGKSFLLAAILILAMPFQTLAQSETPDMPPMPDRLAPPPTVYPPTQADLGAQVFYLVCMACHGDRGQGLTEEWRGALDPADQNCWQSRCHASNYPPGGFVFPKVVPAVVSPGMTAKFETALDLHNYLREKMPWQAPGSLQEAEYWQLTAFLLRENSIDPGPQPLDEQIAQTIRLRDSLQIKPAPEVKDPNWWWVISLFLVLGIAGVGWAWRRTKKLC